MSDERTQFHIEGLGPDAHNFGHLLLRVSGIVPSLRSAVGILPSDESAGQAINFSNRLDLTPSQAAALREAGISVRPVREVDD